MRQPQHTQPVMLALQLALALYDAGRSAGQRELVAREMAALPAMRQRWYRDLLRAIRG